MASSFLELPVEIRISIYEYLLMDNSIVIQSLFTRKNFQTSFMSKHNCGLHPQILSTCKQVNQEASTVLYGSPLFQCATATYGLERLCSQIGKLNFNNIRRLICDPSDLGDIHAKLLDQAGHYGRLESLSTDGYRTRVLDGDLPVSYSDRSDLAEAIKLCKNVQAILQAHSVLTVLAQSLNGISNGGADAVDISNPRAKWRLLASESELAPEEMIVDLPTVIDFLSQNVKVERFTNAGQPNFTSNTGAWSYKEWLESYNRRGRDGGAWTFSEWLENHH